MSGLCGEAACRVGGVGQFDPAKYGGLGNLLGTLGLQVTRLELVEGGVKAITATGGAICPEMLGM